MHDNLAEILTQREDDRTLQCSWNLCYEGKACLGHIAPSLSCDPQEQKIRVLFRADLDRSQAQDIAGNLIRIAENTENFKDPAHIYQRKLSGRHWAFSRIGELARGRRYCFINPLREDDQERAIRFTVDADLTPAQAREVGAYLLSMAAQIAD